MRARVALGVDAALDGAASCPGQRGGSRGERRHWRASALKRAAVMGLTTATRAIGYRLTPPMILCAHFILLTI
jgi:hypothetical protein